MIKQIRRFDLVYIEHGSLLGTQLLRMLGWARAGLLLWTYLPPQNLPLWKFRDLHQRWPFSIGIDGLLCLTRKAEELWSQKWPGKKVAWIDWGADTTMFQGTDAEGEFFFACGRTNRDYATLLAAASRVPAQFVILASRSLVGDLPVPENVRFVEGPANVGTDRGISYAEMIGNYYGRAKAVLISRKDIADDTSGLTNLLEALAMGRPVAITRTGSLDLDVESARVGRFVPPQDSAAWADLLNQWLRDPDLLAGMRRRALQIVREHYNHERHGHDVAWFVHDLLGTSSGGKPQ
jgi:glycosyltransferase involved in cell wall biosynthesis